MEIQFASTFKNGNWHDGDDVSHEKHGYSLNAS